ncbi:MAG: insulinase family protein [Clostridiales bacterium]|nr:insulinase family protein [Clostridiales bacterium]
MKIKKIETKKFKTNVYALYLTIPLTKENVTYNALIPTVLKRGCEKYNNQLEISKKLEEMYDATFGIGITKVGNDEVLKFYLESLNNNYLPNNEDLSKTSIEMLLNIVMNPYLVNGKFDDDYVEQEKENLKKVIESRKDNKDTYATNRLLEEMFKEEPYGLYKFGNIDEIDNITSEKLYEKYKELIKNSEKYLYIVGDVENLNIESYNIDEKEITISKEFPVKISEKENIVKEQMDVTQGKLVIGLNTPNNKQEVIALYNTILGKGANSKLFLNVREKEGLAYSAGSTYLKRNNAIIISTGIEVSKYNKAIEVIKNQLKDMEDGNITEKEMKDAKQFINAGLNLINESSENMIEYRFDKDLYNEEIDIEKYRKEIEEIKKEDIVKVAKQIKIDTIYFLGN